MNIENRLRNGPLPCIYDRNKLVCTPDCANFNLVMNQIVEAQRRNPKLTLSETVDGIVSGKLGIIEPKKLKRTECKVNPRIPVVSTEIENP